LIEPIGTGCLVDIPGGNYVITSAHCCFPENK